MWQEYRILAIFLPHARYQMSTVHYQVSEAIFTTRVVDHPCCGFIIGPRMQPWKGGIKSGNEQAVPVLTDIIQDIDIPDH